MTKPHTIGTPATTALSLGGGGQGAEAVAAGGVSEESLARLCSREHRGCFACRPVAQGGLGLNFHVRPDGSVEAEWLTGEGSESYRGIVHGGLQATALDSAMVHALFARGIVARTGELTVRYLRSVRTGSPCRVTGWEVEAYRVLHRLKAEIHQDGVLCAKAQAKFMEVPDSGTEGTITNEKR